jgi:V-type H+-transporting ATPase subunit d
MSIVTFNLSDGFAEAVVRGYRAGILTAADYSNLGQCDGLEGDLSHSLSPAVPMAASASATVCTSRNCTRKLGGLIA